MTTGAGHSTKAVAVDLTHREGAPVDAVSSGIALSVSVAAWIEDLLLYLYRWFGEDEVLLEDDLAAWTGGGPCRVGDLISDLDRAISLLRPDRNSEPHTFS